MMIIKRVNGSEVGRFDCSADKEQLLINATIEDGGGAGPYEISRDDGETWAPIGHAGESLAEVRARLADLVDAETRRRIALGYEATGPTRKHPEGATLHFSLSLAAQMNLVGFDSALVSEWPLMWDCSDDSDALVIADAASAAAFVLAGKGAVAYRVSYGRYVRRAVMDAMAIAEAESSAESYLAGE